MKLRTPKEKEKKGVKLAQVFIFIHTLSKLYRLNVYHVFKFIVYFALLNNIIIIIALA